MRTLDENVKTIEARERALLHERSRAEQLGDWMTATAASSTVLVVHVARMDTFESEVQEEEGAA